MSGGDPGEEHTTSDPDHASVRYLAAKRSVDARTESERVRGATREAVVAGPSVYDAGAGTGVGLVRLLDWGITPGEYRGVDRAAAVIDHAVDARADELAARGIGVDRDAGGERAFRAGNTEVSFAVGDALSLVPEGTADLVFAASFLDLVSIPDALDRFAAATTDGGLVCAPATFDGGTFFAPTHPADEVVSSVFHAHIDRDPARTSAAARRVVAELRSRPGELLAVDSSDWIVRPTDDGYPDEDAYFLDRVLGFVAGALLDREVDRITTATLDGPVSPLTAERTTSAVDHDAVLDWLASRRTALERGELVYVAHNMDLLYRPG